MYGRIKKYFNRWIDKIRNFLRQEVLSSTHFLKKHHDTLLVILLPSVAFLIARIVSVFISQTSSFQIFFQSLYIAVALILVYIFSPSSREKINQHQAIVAIVAILISIILFFWQQEYASREQFIKKEVLLKEENNRNYSYLKIIITDLPKYPKTIFWRDFSLIDYQQYWDQIQFTKSQECKNLYADLIIRLGILNNINRIRQQLILVPNDLNESMLKNASSTMPVFNGIIKNCQAL